MENSKDLMWLVRGEEKKKNQNILYEHSKAQNVFDF